MKKCFVVLMFLLTIVPSGFSLSADEYSPHYLPGGKNYLSMDNFTYNNGVLESISPFAVKPHTYYTLSFPDEFLNYGEVLWDIGYYENEEELDRISYDNYDLFVYSTPPNYGKFTFQTPANVNYLSLNVYDNRDYLARASVGEMILEEGMEFTSFEPFAPGNLIDINGPYYQGSGTIIVNVDHPYELSEITAGLRAYDAIEGDVSSRMIVMSDAYSDNKNQVGDYPIIYSVSDLSGNETTFTILVKVVDITKPQLSGTTSIVLSYPNVTTVDAIKTQLNASDNVDGDISNQIELVEEDYTLNQLILGTYELIFKVTDSSNNSTNIAVEIEVIDEQSPIFSGPSSFVIGYNAMLSIVEIIQSQSVLDDYDLDLTPSIAIKTDYYSSNINKIGTYPVVLEVSDSSGNTTEKTIDVQVIDVIGPVVYLDTSIIMVYNDTILGLSDFTQLLINTKELDDQTEYEIFVVFDSYTARAMQKGVYHIALEFKNKTGETKLSKTLEVVVKEKDADGHYTLPDVAFNDEIDEQKFTQRYWLYLASGGVIILTVISNIIWIIMYKKK